MYQVPLGAGKPAVGDDATLYPSLNGLRADSRLAGSLGNGKSSHNWDTKGRLQTSQSLLVSAILAIASVSIQIACQLGENVCLFGISNVLYHLRVRQF